MCLSGRACQAEAGGFLTGELRRTDNAAWQEALELGGRRGLSQPSLRLTAQTATGLA